MAIFPTEIDDAASLQGSYRMLGDDGTDAVDFSLTQLQSFMQSNLAFATNIAGVAGLTDALAGKSDVGHTHLISEVTGLQAELNTKFDNTTAGISNNVIFLGNNSIDVNAVVNSAVEGITGVSPTDDRIPNSNNGQYLIGTTGVGYGQITGDVLKTNLTLNNVDNTRDIDKPISTLTQTALDGKVDDSQVLTNVPAGAVFTDTPSNLSSVRNSTAVAVANTYGNSALIAGASTSAAGVMTASDKVKLDSIESGADVTDTTNVWSSLGISTTGSTNSVLTERGVFTPITVGGIIETSTLIRTDRADVIYYPVANENTGTLYTDANSGDIVRQTRNSTVNTVVSGTGHTLNLLLDSQGGQNLVLDADPSIHPYTPVGHLDVVLSDPAIRYTLEFDVITETYPDGVDPFVDIGHVIDYNSITGALTLPTIYPAGTSFFITVRAESTNTPDQGVIVGFSGINITYVDTPTTFDAPSGGISFGTVGGDITSRTLNTYEEGTWTPGVQSIASGVVLNVITSDYTRIGNTVFLQVRFGVNTNTSSAVADIVGLPYNPGPRGALSYFDDGGILDSSVLIVGGSDDINIYSGNSQASWSDLSGHSNIVISGTYITDE